MKQFFDHTYYQQLCADVLACSKHHQASHAEVTINVDSGFSVACRLGQVETIEHHQNKSLDLTVYFDYKTGSASSTDLSKASIETAVKRACAIATYTSSDPYAGLADREQMAFHYPDLDLDHPWEITPEEALKLAMECETIARQDQRITNSEGASLETQRSMTIYANSHDFQGYYRRTNHSLNCILIAQENGQMHRDYDYTVAREFEKLTPIAILAKSATEKTVKRLGARRIKTQSAPVIFSAAMAKSLLNNLVSALSGSQIYRQASFLVDQLGKQILPSFITITQKPHIPKALGSAPFDSDGACTVEQDYIKDGLLQSYILGSYSARKLAMQPTGNAGGVHNLFINTHDLSFKELLKKMDRGLLITELIGQGVNLVTGDYSRGAFGYWVEQGEIQHPVEEITIAGNLRDMLRNIVAVSDDVDHRSGILTGSCLIENLMIAGS